MTKNDKLSHGNPSHDPKPAAKPERTRAEMLTMGQGEPKKETAHDDEAERQSEPADAEPDPSSQGAGHGSAAAED